MLAVERGRHEAIDQVERVEDEKLVERACGGERAAFDRLYERYFARVYAFVARRIGNRSDVEETVQEVFLGVFIGLASFRGEGAFAAWVLGIARRTIAGRYKKKQHATIPLDDAGEAPAIDRLDSTLRREPSPLEHYECGERIARIEAAAECELSAEQRSLFALHHLEHLPIQEIAMRLSRSEDSVKSNLYRVRRLLLSR
jgi:RNA polymerase sigma-70 factor (ECF subfamily)